MVFGGLGEQYLGGRDVEAWFEEEQQWRLREDFRLLLRMPIDNIAILIVVTQSG